MRHQPAESRPPRFSSENTSSPKSAAPPPSAPRAMASGPANLRLSNRPEMGPIRGDRDWKSGHSQRGSNASSPVITSNSALPATSISLRARISDKEPQLTSGLAGQQRPTNGNNRRQVSPESLSDPKKRTMTGSSHMNIRNFL